MFSIFDVVSDAKFGIALKFHVYSAYHFFYIIFGC